jgi:hypothetical protein
MTRSWSLDLKKFIVNALNSSHHSACRRRPPNNSMQRTALCAAADTERYAAHAASMKLDDGQRTALELVIDGYQFPESDEYWDANWLVVRGRVEHPRGNWTFRDPCLTTFELEQLAAWFEGVGAGEADPASGYFTEPNLHFEYAATPHPAIHVKLAYESAPPWLTDREERLDGATITFPLRLNDPGVTSRSLRALLARYPVRALPERPA